MPDRKFEKMNMGASLSFRRTAGFAELTTIQKKPMSKQAYKHKTGLAGEFLVAGELLRRGVFAAVTYGNAKKADVIAVSGDTAASIEVKSTSQVKWVLGNELPADSSNIWVLVYLPQNESESPQYFILTGKELRELLMPEHNKYNERYFATHGKEYSSKGVVSIQRKLLNDCHLNAWDKVNTALAKQVSAE